MDTVFKRDRVVIFFKFFGSKIKNNWRFYAACHPSKKFILIRYLFFVFYHFVLSPLTAFFLAVTYFIIYPFFKIRLCKLIGSAFGHYSLTTELLLCELDEIADKQFYNVFYIEPNYYAPPVSSQQLHKMWKRTVFILPMMFSSVIDWLNKIIMFFLGNKAYGINGEKLRYEKRLCNDLHRFLEKKPPFLRFTEEEERQAKNELVKLNITKNDQYVCLFVRSKAYNANNPVWNYPERNPNIEHYQKAAMYLADQGYFVLRMGKVVDTAVTWNHPKIIDYANTKIRSDLMDIYLSSTCHFFISNGAGLDSIACIFRRPILLVNALMFPINMFYPHTLGIMRKWVFKNTNQPLTLKEQCYYIHDHSPLMRNLKGFHLAGYYDQHGVQPIENTADELLEVTKEMVARLNNTWSGTREEEILQESYWKTIATIAESFDDPTLGVLLKNRSLVMGAKYLVQFQPLIEG